MRTWKTILTTLALIAALTGCQTGSQQAEPKYISMEQAQSNALHAAQIDAADAVVSGTTLEDAHGITCYKVEFTANGSVYTYSVHAETGEIIEASFRDADAADGTADQTQNTAADDSTAGGNQTSTTADSTVTTLPSASSVQNASGGIAGAAAGNNGGKTAQATQKSNSSKQITESAAKDAALKHAGVKAADATFVKTKQDWENGRLVYEIEFVVPNGSSYKEYDYEIDAYTAAVVSYDYDIEASYTPPASGGSTASSGAAVSEAAAKKTALAQVPGATEANIIKFKLDMDDGRWEYEGEIVYNNMEYDFTIDANTGSIIEWDSESAYS